MQKQDRRKGPDVQIITNGFSRILFINGRRIDMVLDIDLAQPDGGIAPQVAIKLHADNVNVRHISGDKFNRLCGLDELRDGWDG